MKQTIKQLMDGVENVQTSKKIENNTMRIVFKDGTVAFRLHQTNIVTISPDGTITLDSGGWQGPTTKDRLNRFSGFSISQAKSLWTVHTSKGSFAFFDGISFTKKGMCLNEKVADEKAVEDMRKKIGKFVNLLTKDNLPLPDAGDCWDCKFHLGGETHLFTHMEEGYMPGELLVNAMREKGYNDMQIGVHYQLKIVDTFKRALRTYLQKKLLQNVALKGRSVLNTGYAR